MLLIISAIIALSFLLAPLGCALLWQRYNYFSDGLAHACLFSGIISYFLDFSQIISMMIVSTFFALLIFMLKFISNRNNIISLVSSGLVAAAILFASKIEQVGIIEAMLFGDILSIRYSDLLSIVILDIMILLLLKKYYKTLIMVSLDKDLARIYNINVNYIELLTLIILALIVALTIKLLGALLITALLIAPASTARIISRNPRSMIINSVIISLLSGMIGLYSSFMLDLPVSASIVIICLCIYAFIGTIHFVRAR
jgi:zinc transport system permease protein